jgi:SAM-dependent methyltransferase
MNCRHCGTALNKIFADLGNCPPSNAMLTAEKLSEPELYYPLKIFVCENCWLVQVDESKKADEIFNSEYTYFSSFSTSWLDHARNYVEMMIGRFGFNENSQVIEIASNDGYLLQFFKEKGVPVLGVDPAANTAEAALKKGINTIIDFFGRDFANKKLVANGIKADLILGNNVLAHVPDINDFVAGMKAALKEAGVITMEFPHLMRLVAGSQFDTIYHEHFSYLSLTTVKQIFEQQGLELFHVEQLPTHGGSLRIFAQHKGGPNPLEPSVKNLLDLEAGEGITSIDYYCGFQEKMDNIKYDFFEFLLDCKRKGKKIIGYGAAAKGNTLINFCGLKGNDLISFVVDASPHKQNMFLPGSHIPVVSKVEIDTFKPDYIIILPWNLKQEISTQLNHVRGWGAKFVVFVPTLDIF